MWGFQYQKLIIYSVGAHHHPIPSHFLMQTGSPKEIVLKDQDANRLP